MSRFQTKKRFGQHFLHERHIIDKLIAAIHPQQGETFAEIGPGLGALTLPLLEYTQHLDVVEIDRDVIERLKALQHPHLTIHKGDALTFDFARLTPAQGKLRLVGNLPYNISTPLIFHLIGFSSMISDMHFMLQHEVVERITASPGGKTYGRLSVMVQYYCDAEYLFFVPPGAFSPPPKIDSALVKLTPRKEKSPAATNESDLSQLVNQAFSMRRKTLRNNLKRLLNITQIEQAGIDPSLRPEVLSVSDFVALANQYTASKITAQDAATERP